jgi:hypothetical protein
MRLVDLDPQFLRWKKAKAPKSHGRKRPNGSIQWGGFEIDTFAPVKTLAEAHGIRFLCPKSFQKNGGPKGTHSVRIFFVGSPVPPNLFTNLAGETVRWGVSGSNYHDLTLTPSILEQDHGTCGWHGFVTNGDVSII